MKTTTVNNMATKIMKPSNAFKHVFSNRFIKRLNSTSASLCQELETAFNTQINLEFFASFSYLALATFFGKQCVAFPGCYQFFSNQVADEREHAQKLINYLLRRGNDVIFQTIEPPQVQYWDSPLAAFQDALRLEKKVSKKLYQLRSLSDEYGDVCACILLDHEFLENQIEETDKLTRYVTQLERIGGDEAGIYLFDKYLFKETK